jgi:hypothetical protein
MRYYEFKLKENPDAEWHSLPIDTNCEEIRLRAQGDHLEVFGRAQTGAYVDRDGGDLHGVFDWLADLTTGQFRIVNQEYENGEQGHWFDHDLAHDLVQDELKEIRRQYGDTWEEIQDELHGSWGVNEDIRSAEKLPMRYYDGLYVEDSDQGPILYGVDLEIQGDRGALGWYDFQALLSTGQYKILDSRANTNAGGELDHDDLEDSIEEIIADVQKTYGRDWSDIHHELHGSWGVDQDETTEESSPGTDIDEDTAIKNIDSGHLQKAIKAIAQLVHDRQMAHAVAQRSTLEKELAQRFRTRYAAVAADALKAEQGQLTVGQLGLALYRYVYLHQTGHPMGGSRSHNHLLRDFLENDVHVAVDDQGNLHPEESSWGVDH